MRVEQRRAVVLLVPRGPRRGRRSRRPIPRCRSRTGTCRGSCRRRRRWSGRRRTRRRRSPRASPSRRRREGWRRASRRWRRSSARRSASICRLTHADRAGGSWRPAVQRLAIASGFASAMPIAWLGVASRRRRAAAGRARRAGDQDRDEICAFCEQARDRGEFRAPHCVIALTLLTYWCGSPQLRHEVASATWPTEFDLAPNPSRAGSAANRHHWRIADQPTSRLLLACPDQPGLIAAVSGFLADAGLNIVDADQHSSGEGRLLHADGLRRRPRGRARGALRGASSEEIAAPLRDGAPLRRVERAQAGRDHGLARRPLPLRPALALAQRRARRRRRRGRLQPPRPRRPGRLARPPLPPRAGRGRRHARRPSARALELLGGDRPARPRPLHAGPLRRVPAASSARRRSTSTTASCPPSSAPTPTSAPTSAASS